MLQPEQDPPVYYSIVILTILYYSRVLNLTGITSPYPRENIIAGIYILADTQAHQSKNHRQQNNEIFDKTFTMNWWVFFHFQLNQERRLH